LLERDPHGNVQVFIENDLTGLDNRKGIYVFCTREQREGPWLNVSIFCGTKNCSFCLIDIS